MSGEQVHPHDAAVDTAARMRRAGADIVDYAADERLLESVGLLHKARTACCERTREGCTARRNAERRTCPMDEPWAARWALELSKFCTRTGCNFEWSRVVLIVARDNADMRAALVSLVELAWAEHAARSTEEMRTRGVATPWHVVEDRVWSMVYDYVAACAVRLGRALPAQPQDPRREGAESW